MSTTAEWIAENQHMLDGITANLVEAYPQLEGDAVRQAEFKTHMAEMALASQSADDLTIENAKDGMRGFLAGLGRPGTECHVGDIRQTSNDLYNVVSQSL